MNWKYDERTDVWHGSCKDGKCEIIRDCVVYITKIRYGNHPWIFGCVVKKVTEAKEYCEEMLEEESDYYWR